MRREFVFVLMFVLMFSLVAGAGYNVVVPAAVTPATSSGGGGGSSTVVSTNATDDNETATVSGDDDDGGIGDAISDGVDGVKDFVKGLSWGSIVLVLSSLLVVGGAVWYFLKDRRKGYVKVKVKEK